MNWVLIILFSAFGNNGVAITSVRLNSEKACQELQAKLNSHIVVHNEDKGDVLSYCIEDKKEDK